MSQQKKLVPVIEKKNQIVSRLTVGNDIEIPIYGDQTIRLNYHGWPTVCRGEGDTLYVTASLRIAHIDPFAVVVFYESHDKGKTWSEPKIIANTPLDNRDSGVLYLGDGKLIATTFTHDTKHYIGDEGCRWHGWQKMVTPEQFKALSDRWDALDAEGKKGGSYIMLSNDYGKTWSDPIRMPVKAPHGTSLMQDGKTAMFFGCLTYPDLAGFPGMAPGHFHLFTGHNGGTEWKHHGQVKLPDAGEGSFFDEGYCIQLKDGSFLACLRSEKSYLGHWSVFVTRSKDGVEWTEPTPITGPDGVGMKGSPPHLLQLRNGVILLSYSWRHGNCGSRGRVSYDNGLTWSDEFIICVSDQPDHGDLGYPSTVELDDGTLFTTYYQAYGQDKVPSVLYTRWRLEEEA